MRWPEPVYSFAQSALWAEAAPTSAAPRGNWIAVACADHVARGVAGGFMQVCHGKSAPLARIQPGDQVVYYAPTQQMGRPDGLQSFTALGTVQPTAPYRFDMGGGFVPWRRDVGWQAGTAPAAIRPLLAQLEFTQGHKNWAAPLRFGLLRISAQDMACISAAMAGQSTFTGRTATV